MITITDLRTALLDLLHELRETEIKLIIGGGFGIFLKVEYVRENQYRTLFTEWPEPRSTNDLDLFLRPELLIDSEKLKPMAGALDNLGYHVITSAKNYQFVKKTGRDGTREGEIKIDFLTGPVNSFEGTSVKTDERRAHPRPKVGIHAHPVNEAPTLEDGLLSIPLKGNLSPGNDYQADVLLPHPYTFLMMKLFAFKDRFKDENKDFGRYHALDLYSIVATMTESEWKVAQNLRDQNYSEPYIIEAGQLVSIFFSSDDSWGIIRMKESQYFRNELHVGKFISVMAELFPCS